ARRRLLAAHRRPAPGGAARQRRPLRARRTAPQRRGQGAVVLNRLAASVPRALTRQRSRLNGRGTLSMTQPRRILVTGATRGLGRALTAKFVALGHTVIGCGRSRDDVEDLRRQYGPPHDFAVVDVTDRGQVTAWTAQVLMRHGPPDLLLNNAALVNAN